MSLDISVTNPKTGEELSINWLRNPFGLERWARGNVELEIKPDLWDVCNTWNYERTKDIDRKVFKEVIDIYNNHIQNLEVGYFFFNLPNFIQFVAGHYNVFPKETFFGVDKIQGSEYNKSGDFGIPMEYFKDRIFNLGIHNGSVLDHYKSWFKELVAIADMLQNPDTEFYCSN